MLNFLTYPLASLSIWVSSSASSDYYVETDDIRAVCDIRMNKTETHRVRLTTGGNMVDYPGDVSTKTADLTTIKCHWNSVLSSPNARYMCMDVKDFNLNSVASSSASSSFKFSTSNPRF